MERLSEQALADRMMHQDGDMYRVRSRIIKRDTKTKSDRHCFLDTGRLRDRHRHRKNPDRNLEISIAPRERPVAGTPH